MNADFGCDTPRRAFSAGAISYSSSHIELENGLHLHPLGMILLPDLDDLTHHFDIKAAAFHFGVNVANIVRDAFFSLLRAARPFQRIAPVQLRRRRFRRYLPSFTNSFIRCGPPPPGRAAIYETFRHLAPTVVDIMRRVRNAGLMRARQGVRAIIPAIPPRNPNEGRSNAPSGPALVKGRLPQFRML